MGAELCLIFILSLMGVLIAAASALWHGLQCHNIIRSNQVPDDRE